MIDLRLNTLTVVKKADLAGRDEPMLWTLFVILSLETLNSHQFVVTTDPLKGKLAKAGKGDSVPIPAAVGRFQPAGQGVGLVGVVGIAFDNDLRTNAQIKSGYAAAAAALNQAILDHFPKYGFAEVGAAEEAEIAAKLTEAVKKAFFDESVWRTVVGGKPMGGTSYTRKLDAPKIDEPVTLVFESKNKRARYEVVGRLKAEK
jgi:hypothetical protein